MSKVVDDCAEELAIELARDELVDEFVVLDADELVVLDTDELIVLDALEVTITLGVFITKLVSADQFPDASPALML